MCVVNKDMQFWHEVVERWCGPTYGLHKHTAAVHCSKFPPNPPHGHALLREREAREATCQCVAILVLPPPQFIFHSTLTQRQRHICFSFSFVLPSSNFLSFTSYFTLNQSEVRDDRPRWLRLSAWVIHGNGKGANGSCGWTPLPAILSPGCLLPQIINR